ncbi:MAG: hypothetical protein LBV17_11850 [Treponema sp.]|nr:hypothetical protein [Treponema sp.]
MKKQIILPVFIIAAALFFSCNKTGGSSSAKTEGVIKSAQEESAITGYALKTNTGVYTIEGEDNGSATTKTKWDSSLVLGESVKTGKTRPLTFKNKEYNFIEVLRDNKKEGFALVSQIAVGGRLAVVTDEKANLFTAPKTVNVTNSIISRKTVLVYFPESESGGFVEVKGIDSKSSELIPGGRYMRLSSLSRNDSDIQASILLQTAQTMTDKSQVIAKEALLKSALQDYPDSVFYHEIKEIVSPSESQSDSGSSDSEYYDEGYSRGISF